MRSTLRTVVLGLVAAAIAGVGVPSASAAGRARPVRIMSLNVCTDLLLLQIAPKARIASVTFLAVEPARSLLPGATAGIPLNHGSAEDIVNVRPDLILESGLSSLVAAGVARRVGARVVDVKDANSFADIRDIVRQVGDEVGEPERASALIRRMDATLAQLAAHPLRRRLRVVAWEGSAAVPGQGSLSNAIITTAGATNIAARPGQTSSTFGVEELLVARPDALLFSGATLGRPSPLTEQGQARLVRRLYAGGSLVYNSATHACGLPQSADSAADLHRAFEALSERGILH